MDTYTFIAEVLKAISWPLTIIILLVLFILPKNGIFKYIESIKYKGVEIYFKQELQSLRNDIPKTELDKANKQKADFDSRILKLAKSDPSKAILESWNITQQLIYEKLVELYPKDSPEVKRITPDLAFRELDFTGVLPPNAERTLNRLYQLKDSIERHFSDEITSEIAVQYYELSKYIQQIVSSLTELPKIRLTALTYMILALNALIDTGKYQSIPIKVIEDEIENGTILEYLTNISVYNLDLVIKTYPNFRDFYISYLQNMPIGDESKWRVENSGLCLLLAWTNEIIQQGSGWHPSD